MRVPDINNFVFTFESQGTSFIFEDIVVEFYDPIGSVSISHNGIKSVYFSKRQIAKMNQEGKELSLNDLRALTKSLKKTIIEAVRETPKLAKKKNFDKNDAVHMLGTLAKICREYFYFDYSFWDETFVLAVKNKRAAEKTKFVQKNKNKIRAPLDKIFFGRGYLSVLVSQVSKLTKVPKDQLQYYRCSDILDVFDGKKESKQEILARKQAFAHYKTDSGITFYSGNKAVNYAREFLKKKSKLSASNVIQGKTAHSIGKNVKGKVRVIVRDYGNPKAVQNATREMKKGEILVSQTTDPELMPALRKAGAIVTDIGGMLSHSAITARELDIPCIIDTKDASKRLKTGDLVEVDANKGVVKLIKSKA